MLRSVRWAANADGQRRPINARKLRPGPDDFNSLGLPRRDDSRRDGALEKVLRMPVSGAGVVGGFDRRPIGRVVCAVCVMLVMMGFAVDVLVILAVDMHMPVIAAGVEVEVESGARRRDRRHEKPDGQRSPRRQPYTHPLYRSDRLPRSAEGCHGSPAIRRHLAA